MKSTVNELPESFEFEGAILQLAEPGTPLEPGDTYIACRNQGIKLLTVWFLGTGCVHSVENAYSYDIHECRKVLSLVS